MTYLHWADAPAWMACPGRPALEESEEGTREDPAVFLSADGKAQLEARKTALAAAGAAVELLPLQALDVAAITGERGALGFASLILAEYTDHSTLEVYPADKLLGLAALIKYSILHRITATNVGHPEELFAFGATVTEAAQLSLNLRASVTALEHLVPGDYCRSCRSAYRCPALTRELHEDVFGPLESAQDPDARVTPVPGTIDPGSTWNKILPKLPLIEAWVEAVKRAAGLAPKTCVDPPRRRRKKRKVSRGRPSTI